MRFAKLQALGNDFLIVERQELGPGADLGDLARSLCQRRTGAGADGLILISPSESGDYPGFRIFNADGSEAEISGNGLRCAAAFLLLGEGGKNPAVAFQTAVGVRESRLIEKRGRVFLLRTDMGVPRLSPPEIPFNDGKNRKKIVDYPLDVLNAQYLVTVVSMGNPHCAVFVERFPAAEKWHRIGRAIETHPAFPNRTNVEFIRVLDRETIEVLFWERGVGETLSSGSGACGAAVSALLRGCVVSPLRVKTRLGELAVEWGGEKETVFQTGPAEIIYTGASSAL